MKTTVLNFLKRYKKPVMHFVFWGIFVVPLLIHIVFKIPAICDFFSAEWGAGDVLAFYGVLLGALATVGGVFLSIQYAQSNYNQDLINRSLPFITITKMQYNPVAQFESTQTPASSLGYEYPIDMYYYIISNKEAEVMGQLTDRQKQIVLGGGLYNREIAEGVMATQSVKLLYLPLEVDNIGNGAATTFSIGLYIPPYSPEKHPRCFSLARSLRAGEKIRIAIYSENILQDNTGEYELCVSYYDIFGNKYEQKFAYKIFQDDKENMCASLAIRGTQKRLSGENELK